TRALVVEVVRAGAAAPTVAIRINGVRTRWWRDDLAAAAVARPDCVVIPKVESPDDVGAVAALLPDGIGIEVQIETARGLVAVEQVAGAGHGLEALVFGPGDLAASGAGRLGNEMVDEVSLRLAQSILARAGER